MTKYLKNLDKAIFILIAIIAVGLLEIYVVGNEISVDNARVEEVVLDIEAEYLRREKFDELIAQYKQIEAEGLTDELESVLPDTDDFLAVIVDLENIAGLAGNNSIAMQLGEARLTSEGFEITTGRGNIPVRSGGTGYDIIEIEVTLSGSYQALEQFLYLLDQSPFYMNVASLRMTRVVPETGPALNTHMLLQIYVQKVIYTQAN